MADGNVAAHPLVGLCRDADRRSGLGLDGSVSIARRGAVFRIERMAEGYAARWVSPVGIIPCEGARDPVSEAALSAALQKGGWERVTRLYRGEDVPDERCWLRAPGWSLAYS